MSLRKVEIITNILVISLPLAVFGVLLYCLYGCCGNKPEDKTQYEVVSADISPDGDRIIKACFSAVRGSEAPTIEIFDSSGRCLMKDMIGRKNDSPGPGRAVSIPLYERDQFQNGRNIDSGGNIYAVLKVTGACTGQNERIASAGYREWIKQKRKSMNNLVVQPEPWAQAVLP